MSDVCRHACRHADCAMDRRDALPAPVTRALVRDEHGDWIEYRPSDEAAARSAAIARAYDEAAEIAAALADQ